MKGFVHWDEVPPQLRSVLLDITWDNATLFALSLPVEPLPVAELAWQPELPWWRDGERRGGRVDDRARRLTSELLREFAHKR